MAFFIAFLLLAGVFGSLTIEQTVMANTWVYHYYVSVDMPDGASGFLVLPVPSEARLLTGLRVTSGIANWSRVESAYGQGLYVGFGGPCVLESSFQTLAFFGAHPDDRLAPQNGNESGWSNGWQVWIEYQGTKAASVNFQFGSGYVFNGALVFIGPLRPGWNNYSMFPAP